MPGCLDQTATAVAFCKAGKGNIRVNGVPLNLVEPEIMRMKVYEPLLVCIRGAATSAGGNPFEAVDIKVRVNGGGHTSQVYAIRQALARAVVAYTGKYNDAATALELRKTLISYDRTLLVSDPRRCEPKKFGGVREKCLICGRIPCLHISMSTARCPCKVPKGESIVSSSKFSLLIPTFAISSPTYVLTSLHLELELMSILALISSSSYWGRLGASLVFLSIGVGLEGDALEFGQRRTRKAVMQNGGLQWMCTAVLCDPIYSSCAQLCRRSSARSLFCPAVHEITCLHRTVTARQLILAFGIPALLLFCHK